MFVSFHPSNGVAVWPLRALVPKWAKKVRVAVGVGAFGSNMLQK